ncbi:MAG TPA: regulatory protein GemA [Oleiagrimonas sp.]|nr:regulatory protein GemA [Oleiagrimonas sp.]
MTTTDIKRSSSRNRELAMIHIAAQQLGLIRAHDDSAYRDMLWSIGRVRSAGKLDTAGRFAVLKHLENCGWKRPGHTKTRRQYQKGSQAALIRHLWTRLHQAGAVQDNSDRALRAYVRSQSAPHHPQQVGWDDPTLMPKSVAGAVIEHLKQWCARLEVEH